MFMVQFLLEPLVANGPRLSPERTYKPKSFVEHVVNPEDDNCEVFKNLFHCVTF